MEVGGRRKTSMGFTIIEVMIVLAISSMIVISALILVNGRQNSTEFTTSVNDLQQQLQQVVNETASGYFPGVGGFTCQAISGGPVTFTGTASAQGTNQGCVFLGKALQFGSDATGEQVETIPLVGRQYQTNGITPVLNLGQALPRAAWPLAIGEPASLKNLSSVYNMEYGLHVASYNSACGVSTPPEAVCYEPISTPGTYVQTGIASIMFGDSSGTLASINSLSGNVQSGSEQLSMYGVSTTGGSQKDQSTAVASADIGNVPGVAQPGNPPGGVGMGWSQAASKVLVCVTSGGTNESGLFIIGSNSSSTATTGDGGLSVTLQIKEDRTCA